jgi:succinate dehydrogenase / fumarate reductase, cytochrome b subunit
MNWITKTFSSSIGQKIIMSLTGLFLCSFLVVHVSGNLQLFKDDYGLAFNKYAVFMTTNPFIKVVSYVLYFFILWHAFKGLHLAWKNNRARPVKYAEHAGRANSHWTSRNMGVLGTILLVFIAVHMSDFWWEYKFGDVPYTQYSVNLQTGAIDTTAVPPEVSLQNKMEDMIANGMHIYVVKDLYKEVSEEFKNWPLVLLYLISMFALSFHLYHGFKSAFQSLGINHIKYNGFIRFIGIWIFAILIPIAFAAMPIYFFFK